MLPQQDRPIRILMIDDHAVLRAGLRMIIENHIGMVWHGRSGGSGKPPRIVGRNCE
jgi:hypothetical protein